MRQTLIVTTLLALCIALLAGPSALEARRVERIERIAAAFDPAGLSPRGRRAWEGLLGAEIVVDVIDTWTWSPNEITWYVFDLWDEGPERSTPAFLALCEQATPAGRLYALAGLHRSDPWTYRRALFRYGRGQAHVEVLLGCFHYEGTEEEMIGQMMVEGDLPHGWRGYWSRTDRTPDGD